MEKIREIVQKVVDGLFATDVVVQLTRTNTEFGDYATNVAMLLAKKVGKNPREIAAEITVVLQKDLVFEKVDVAGPGFINLTIESKELARILDEAFAEARGRGQTFGENQDGLDENGEPRTAVVEYPSPNMAKPFSVGHLRSGNQGWAARNLMKANGWHVITDDHLGDYGSPFGFWVVGFKKFSSDERLEKGGIYELGRVYVAVREELKAEKERGESSLADEAQGWLLKLEDGDPEAAAFSEKFNAISLAHIHDIMRRLGISTDYELGEKFFVERGKKAVEDLLARGIAEKNKDGSVIVRLDEYGIDVPILIQKSNGAALYATTDLATMIYREKEWHADFVTIATGAEQKFYFEQLAVLAKKIGLKHELRHLWFGTIDQLDDSGKRTKMSSRKGVILMEEFLDTAEAKARENVKNQDASDEDIHRIALGAIKFTDFAQDRRTGILFDWDRMFNLTGYSGPYVQYAAVRVNKILRDNLVNNLDELASENYDYIAEKPVILQLLAYPDVVRVAALELEPHRIASYVYELARVINKYYETTPVATTGATEVEKHARLNLLAHVAAVMAHALGILGIEVPKKM